MATRLFPMGVAIALGAAGPAFAGMPFVATLSTATSTGSAVLNSVIWRCENTTCTSTSQLTISDATGCRDVARRYGPVVAFHSAHGDMKDEDLAKCNEGIKPK